jgi:hypothetical protein
MRRWKYNTGMDLKETGWLGMEWISLAQDTNKWQAFVNTVMNLGDSIKRGEFLYYQRNY